MARINFEDTLFKDDRFIELMLKLGSKEMAIGSLVFAWMSAQKFWINSDNGIPKTHWVKQKLRKEIIDVGLAEDRGEFVYISGSKEQFAWLRECSEAGKKGAAKRLGKKPNDPQPTSTNLEGSPTSLLSSLSSSLSSQDSFNLPHNSGKKKKRQPPANAGAFVAAYCRVWKAKYGTNPEMTGKVSGIARRLAGDMGTERAASLVEAFLEMNDAWFLKKRHDLVTFEQNLNAVVQYHDTGSRIYASKANEIERAEANADTWDRAAKLVNEKLGSDKW